MDEKYNKPTITKGPEEDAESTSTTSDFTSKPTPEEETLSNSDPAPPSEEETSPTSELTATKETSTTSEVTPEEVEADKQLKSSTSDIAIFLICATLILSFLYYFTRPPQEELVSFDREYLLAIDNVQLTENLSSIYSYELVYVFTEEGTDIDIEPLLALENITIDSPTDLREDTTFVTLLFKGEELLSATTVSYDALEERAPDLLLAYVNEEKVVTPTEGFEGYLMYLTMYAYIMEPEDYAKYMEMLREAVPNHEDLTPLSEDEVIELIPIKADLDFETIYRMELYLEDRFYEEDWTEELYTFLDENLSHLQPTTEQEPE